MLDRLQNTLLHLITICFQAKYSDYYAISNILI